MQRRLALLVLVLSAAACSRPQPNSARIDPALVPLLPSDTTLAAGLRIDKLKNTAFYQQYIEGRRIPLFEEFAKKTGLDLRKDVWELCLASNGRESVIFVRGKFGDLFGLEPQIRIEGMRRMNYKGYGMLGAPQYAVMFLQSGVAAVSDVTTLEAIIDNRDKPRQAPQAVLDLVQSLPPEAHAWVVTEDAGALVPLLPRQGNFANLVPLVKDLRQLSAYADLTAAARLRIRGEYGDPKVAKQTSNALRAVLGLVRMTSDKAQPAIKQLYDSIQVVLDDRTISVSAESTLEVLEALPLGWRGDGVPQVH